MELFLAWLIESSLLIMLIFGIRRLFMGKIPYVAVYALWLVVLVRFLIPVNFISTPVSVANLVSEAVFGDENARDDGANLKTVPGEEKETVQTPVYPIGEGMEKSAVEDVVAEDVSVGGQSGTYQMEQPQSTTGSQKIDPETDRGQKVKTKNSGMVFAANTGRVLSRIWLAGAILLFLMIFLSNVRLLCKLKKSRVFYGQRGNVKIYTVYDLKNPCLYGFFRAAVYVPKDLISSGTADEEDLKQMIAHELVHYRHGDHIWAMLRMLLVSVYWFHPFLWLAALYSKKDAELFCDEATIRLLGEEKRFCYGEMLVRLAGDHARGEFFYSLMPMSRKGKEMEQRIRAISRKGRYRKWILLPLILILLVTVSVTCSTGLGVLHGEKKQVSGEGREDTVSGSAENMQSFLYTDWQKRFDQAAGMVFATTPQEVFTNYIRIFTDAVNTGDISDMGRVLAVGSEAYEQQCALVQNYYKRGIREEVRSFSAASVRMIDPFHAEVSSKEKIRVFYADGSSKTVRQKYRYRCERFVANSIYAERPVWAITKMEAIG